MSRSRFSARCWAVGLRGLAGIAAVATVAGATGLSGCAEAGEGLPFGASAEGCATCHEAHYDAWATSPHATSGTSPVFEALLVEVGDAWGEDARAACVGCHQPGHGGDVGIGCVACHGATGNTGERDGRLRVDVAAPLLGPTGEGDNGAHQIRTSGLLTSASLCGTCHEVTGPGLLDEPTLTEYRASAAADQGLSCASCHMAEGEHRFVGVDPLWDADPTAQARAREATRGLFRGAVTLALEQPGGAGADVVVTLTNVGAGHALPTGAAFLRDLWVDVSFGDGDAARVLPLGARMTREGAPAALITRADEVVSRSLEPGESRSAPVPVPDGATEVTATLSLRAVRWETLTALGLDDRRRQVPTLALSSTTLALD